MTKWEFMRKLEELLLDISPTEREEALQYYNDYINDAGKENEAEAIESLGTPEQVAAIVKNGLDGSGQGMFTEHGYFEKEENSDNSITKYDASREKEGKGEERFEQAPKYSQTEKKKPMSAGMIVLLIILGIFASPILIGLAGSLFGVVVSVLAVLFACVLVVVILTVVFFIVSVILVITGFASIITLPFIGLALIGCGCLMFSLAILMLLASITVCGKLVPAMFRGIVSIFHNLFHRKEGARA